MSVATTVPASLQELADRYTQAWNDHDLDEICALHTADTAFYIKGIDGEKGAEGGDACREMFRYLLDAWPDQHFELVSLTVRWPCAGSSKRRADERCRRGRARRILRRWRTASPEPR